MNNYEKKMYEKKMEDVLKLANKLNSMTKEELEELNSKNYTEGWGYYKTYVKMPQEAFNSLPDDEKRVVEILVNVADDDIKDGNEFNPKAFIEAANFIYHGCDKSEAVQKAILEAFDYFSTYDLINDPIGGLKLSMGLLLNDEVSFNVKIPICDKEHSVVIKREALREFIPVWNKLRTTWG